MTSSSYWRGAFASISVFAALSSGACAPYSAAPIEYQHVEILHTYPFDSTTYTQGLEVDGDRLLVSGGQYNRSRIYYYTLDGVSTHNQPLDPELFGEGATRFGDTVWQLTWQSGIAFARNAESLDVTHTVRYPGQGWGLCSYEDYMVMSDGSDTLRILDGESFAERDRISITRDGEPVSMLNELACTKESGTRYVYANIYLSTDIYKIDLDHKRVVAIIDASTVPNRTSGDTDHVLNGIANIPGTDRFYITGKQWPDLYEVRFSSEPA
ncbi:glutaminyl-peptide cyclotransferase [Corynebacterium sp. ES2794-CONJ1]|uniref:glutaminyl-peptide cyclotransferase n=1 Tax=Corynebacterium sp. ES2794-CONJ1 TaxID=2980553 RepID=UPI0021D9AD74|nr:glutaminyl-peptide cyclotransferase [Corynebacterium sp. ES2794-CONJ1]MCU9519078.1 glutaminyl-peptide cyclotransferase [Corynebacterium sp. ES2794-CONJ1]